METYVPRALEGLTLLHYFFLPGMTFQLGAIPCVSCYLLEFPCGWCTHDTWKEKEDPGGEDLDNASVDLLVRWVDCCVQILKGSLRGAMLLLDNLHSLVALK